MLQHVQRHGWGTSYEWWKKNKEQYVGGLADRVNSQVQILNRALPKPLAVDPKSRTILPDTITQVEQDAFTRHKVDPEQALALKRKGQLPPALMNELRTLNTLREWSGFQAEYRSKQDAARGGDAK